MKTFVIQYNIFTVIVDVNVNTTFVKYIYCSLVTRLETNYIYMYFIVITLLVCAVL